MSTFLEEIDDFGFVKPSGSKVVIENKQVYPADFMGNRNLLSNPLFVIEDGKLYKADMFGNKKGFLPQPVLIEVNGKLYETDSFGNKKFLSSAKFKITNGD
jgi:hypothetical protein